MSNPEAAAMFAQFIAGADGPPGRSQTSPVDEDTPTHADLSEVGRAGIVATFFKVSTWKGLPNYVCVICEAGFLDPDRGVDHVLSSHSEMVNVGPERATVDEDEPTADTAEADTVNITWPEYEGNEL